MHLCFVMKLDNPEFIYCKYVRTDEHHLPPSHSSTCLLLIRRSPNPQSSVDDQNVSVGSKKDHFFFAGIHAMFTMTPLIRLASSVIGMPKMRIYRLRTVVGCDKSFFSSVGASESSKASPTADGFSAKKKYAPIYVGRCIFPVDLLSNFANFRVHNGRLRHTRSPQRGSMSEKQRHRWHL
jgi:hypothetical protein